MTERLGHWDLDAQTKPEILKCPGVERNGPPAAFVCSAEIEFAKELLAKGRDGERVLKTRFHQRFKAALKNLVATLLNADPRKQAFGPKSSPSKWAVA